tara:strand:- start:343 stop:549 length:207 start_codon:yes stop_codon:yes gene_type:complete
MKAILLVLLCLAIAMTLHAKAYRFRELGWAGGQDFTQEFRKLLTGGTLESGDELVPDHNYRISGVLPT